MNMNELIEIPDRKKLKAIAYYQIFGGMIGIGLIIYNLFFQLVSITNYKFIFFLIAAGLYLFSIICGIYLIKERWEKGINLTIINQILQTIQFSIFGYTFIYVSGLTIYTGIDYTNDFLLKFDFFLSYFHFSLTLNEEVLTVGVNLFSLILIYYITKFKNRIEEKKELLDAAREKSNE